MYAARKCPSSIPWRACGVIRASSRRFPASSGFMGLPSNVNNVETLMSVPMILRNGADWYKKVGTPGCSGTKLYCLSGKLNRTGLVELPMGATLKDIINSYGGGMKKGSKFKFAQVGGSAGGVLGKDLMDLPLDIDQPMKQGVTLGSGVVLVCDEKTCAVDFLLQILSFFEHESCGQCVPCRVGTAHLHHLARKFASRTADPGDIDLMIKKAGVDEEGVAVRARPIADHAHHHDAEILSKRSFWNTVIRTIHVRNATGRWPGIIPATGIDVIDINDTYFLGDQ